MFCNAQLLIRYDDKAVQQMDDSDIRCTTFFRLLKMLHKKRDQVFVLNMFLGFEIQALVRYLN